MEQKLREALTAGQQLLKSRGVESARLECELLFAHILGIKRHQIYLDEAETFSPEHMQIFDKLIQRRLKGEPLQYILGCWEFMGLPFKVDMRVLIPRWETECLVDAILKEARRRDSLVHILDLGTGSGAIAVSLAHYLPQAKVTAVDNQKGALEAAKENAELNGAAHRIEFIHGDMFAPLALPGSHNKFDIIVSNPPYIPTEEIGLLMKEVRDYEPVTALDGGVDGLDYYRQIAGEAGNYLKEDGFVAMEMGAGQSQSIRKIFLESERGWQSFELIQDPAGIDRIAIVYKRQGVCTCWRN
ncbi:MAG: peptide chain release factor N(5)-glutamine methyltransferase [Clostridia bacterium]|nr:peptide chain release factor N(5)-glutamine methyltransferase [Clostridia bacterium]